MLPNLNEIFRKTIEQIKQLLRRLRPFFEFIDVVDPVDYLKLKVARVRIKAGVKSFIYSYNVPGLSLAIAYKGRLVFSEGYGLANKATNESVTPEHLFRIASISKPITSVAVFRLIAIGPVNLSDRVFGSGGILGNTYGTPPDDSDIDQITVQHLLEHTSGWSNSPTDIMFDPDHLNKDQDALISWMVANRSLAHTPGDKHEYLNFGYLVLGRVIEEVSNMSYVDYVRQNVLTLCGISDMHIAGNTLADRRTNEVVYYSQDAYNPYGMQISRMDAHGGWIASPTDLVRFLVHVDGSTVPADILPSSSIATMVTPTTATLPNGTPSGYAKGWYSNTPTGNYFHDGDLSGTAGLIVRDSNEYCYAVLVNSRFGAIDQTLNESRILNFRGALDQLMPGLIGAVKDWPKGDLL